MIEPRPKNVKQSELSHRKIRVGIVLKEDEKKEIRFETLNVPCTVNETINLQAKTSYVVSLDGTKVQLKGIDGEIIESTECLNISPNTKTFPDGSMAVHETIAGRTFHWKKALTARLPGDVEITAQENTLQLVNTLPFEEYLACVVVSEMSSGAPPEFVKAQTVAARSWAVCFLNEKHPGERFELCNDDDCQRYQGVTFADKESLQCSLETLGEYLIGDDNSVIPGYYSKSCGGASEDPEACFGFPVPGLISVTDGESPVTPTDLHAWLTLSENEQSTLWCGGDKQKLEALLGGVDDLGEYFRWEHRESKEDLASYLNDKSTVTNASQVTRLVPLRYGPSGRIHEMEIHFVDTAGQEKTYTSKTQYEIRSLLHRSFLYSSAIEIEDQEDHLLFRGAGWGHGVGLCQIGASFQALAGRGYRDILTSYFPKATILKCYDN